MSNTRKIIGRPLLMVLAVVICLSMLRLGVWQLDRAAQKQQIVSHFQAQTSLPALKFDETSAISGQADENNQALRYRSADISGRYLADQTLWLDRQVSDQRVGYAVITPFQSGSRVILVNRGWLPVGESREQLPEIATPNGDLQLQGRLNLPTAAPPLWDSKYQVNDGVVWQYLDMSILQSEFDLELFPLVLELAPDQAGVGGFHRAWQRIDDQWVNRHKAYALQWFALAVAFFIASLVVLIRTR
ncbi:MAG: SURF1 family protein [Gammaproteobacteria bacterium]|nr:SURF1 family protein [Gammaproteobacteria bacterium]